MTGFLNYKGFARDRQLFKVNPATGEITPYDASDYVAIALIKAGDTGLTFSGDYTSAFVAEEANVDTTGVGWGNDLIADTVPFNNSTPQTSDVSPETVFGSTAYTTYARWHAFDNDVSDNNNTWLTASTTTSNIGIQLSTAKTIKSYRIAGSYNTGYSPSAWTFEGSNNGSTWTVLHTGSKTDWTDKGYSALYEIATPASYTYYRVNITANNGGAVLTGIANIDMREAVYATTTTTFQFRPLTGGASSNIDMSSIAPLDDTDTPITDGNILIEYSTDGSTWSSQVGLTAFKALSDPTSDTFWLRFEMVGATKLKSVSIQTVASYAEMEATGLAITVAGVIGTRVGDKGIAFNGDTADANYLNDYEEGTWTPAPDTGSFSSATGTYTKIGNLVTLFFDITVGTGGGTTMTAPFTASAQTNAGPIYTSSQDYTAGYTAPSILIGGGTAIMYFRQIGDNVAFASMPLTASSNITGSITFQV